MFRPRVAALLLLALCSSASLGVASDEVPLKFNRLDLNDGRKLKNVVVKSYDAKTQRLLIVADGKAMMIAVASVPPPFNEQLKSAPPSGGSVNTFSPPPPPAPPYSREVLAATDQYLVERPVPTRPPPVVYMPHARPAPAPAPADPMLAQAGLGQHQAVARAHAQRYYRYEHIYGSNAIIVRSVSLDLTVPAPVPGWIGRFRTEGKAYVEYYDSRGRSFQRATSNFEILTEQKPGEALQVFDFSRKG